MSPEPYIQCLLNKPSPEGTISQTSWIPSKFAQQGQLINLREGQIWSKGWKVIEVFQLYTRYDLLNLNSDHHRWVSVIK